MVDENSQEWIKLSKLSKLSKRKIANALPVISEEEELNDDDGNDEINNGQNEKKNLPQLKDSIAALLRPIRAIHTNVDARNFNLAGSLGPYFKIGQQLDEETQYQVLAKDLEDLRKHLTLADREELGRMWERAKEQEDAVGPVTFPPKLTP